MVVIIIAVLALAVAVVAVVMAMKKQTVKVTKETVIEHAPANSPFYYDANKKIYTLDGNLKVNGALSCLANKEEEE